MPSRHIVKSYAEDAYYHIFNKGLNGTEVFIDHEDYSFFLHLLERHLSRTQHFSSRRKPYESYAGRIELQAYVLQPTHFHLLMYLNNDTSSISELMRKVAGAYTVYFNKKYNRVGPLFQSAFKASRIHSEDHIVHVTRFIHRLPERYYEWLYSSLGHYISDKVTEWVVPDRVYRMYEWGMYEPYLNNHDHHTQLHEQVEPLLAHW
jgi:putative transposase